MPYILLKFDDLSDKTIDSFQRVKNYCSNRDVVTCFGFIGSSLCNDPNREFIDSIIKMKAEGVELWNHGYLHAESEFSEQFYNQQLDSIRSTQELMKKYLGEKPITFGSPHNNSTEKTVRVLRDSFPEICNYFFMADAGGVSHARQLVLRCNYEIKTGVIDLDFFLNEYNRIKRYPYFVMQGHPSYWDEDNFDKFKQIIEILIRDGNEFVTTKELANIKIAGFQHELADSWRKDLLEFICRHDKVVLYGAGEIGREVYRYMSINGISPDAFTVSAGHRKYAEICGTPIYEMPEAREQLVEFAIVPTLLGRNHNAVFGGREFEGIDIWKPENGTYDEFIDYVRYVVSLESW